MALIVSMHRVLHLQRCTGAMLLRSSFLKTRTNSGDPSVKTLKLDDPLRRPQPCVFYCSNNNKSADLPPPEEVDIGPGTWQEVYNGILTTQIKMVKIFSLSTSCLGLMFQPIFYHQFGSAGAGVLLAAGGFIGFFTFITPFLIHTITKKYVTKLEYDPQTDLYSATTLNFFLREKKINFTVNDVKVPSVPGLFTTFHAKNKPLFVEPRMFDDIEHYGRIMGYDKPIDFRFDEEKEQ